MHADPNLGQIAATAWESIVGDGPTDNIFNSRAFFFSLNKNGFKTETQGGRVFELTVEYAENTNFHSYGEMDEIDTSRIDIFDAARFDQKIAGGAVTFSDLELLRTLGKAGKINLMGEKMENGRDSHTADMNRQFLGTGAAATDIDGIQVVISTTPTTGSVGSINGGTFSFWRNRQNSGAQSVSAYDNLRSALTTTYNQCSLGGMKMTPKWVCTDRSSFQGYEQILVALEQIESMRSKANADVAFDNEFLKFKGAMMYYDEDAPSANAYLYNNKNLKIAYLRGGWMKMYPGQAPYNQLAKVHKVATFCNLVTNARRHLGVVNAIS